MSGAALAIFIVIAFFALRFITGLIGLIVKLALIAALIIGFMLWKQSA